jgi:hypothetical protein
MLGGSAGGWEWRSTVIGQGAKLPTVQHFEQTKMTGTLLF